MSSCKVQCCLFLIEEEGLFSDLTRFYSHEFLDTSGKLCLGSEWAQNHFGDVSEGDLREAFGLPSNGHFQVLATIKLEWQRSAATEEYDEWFEVLESEYQSVSNEFVDELLKDS